MYSWLNHGTFLNDDICVKALQTLKLWSVTCRPYLSALDMMKGKLYHASEYLQDGCYDSLVTGTIRKAELVGFVFVIL